MNFPIQINIKFFGMPLNFYWFRLVNIFLKHRVYININNNAIVLYKYRNDKTYECILDCHHEKVILPAEHIITYYIYSHTIDKKEFKRILNESR